MTRDERTDRDQNFVNTVTKPGRYSFGDGLFVDVKPKGGKYWVFAYNGSKVGEGPRERISLGSAKTMPLKVARRESLLLDQVLENGDSPKAHHDEMRRIGGGKIPTWRQAVEDYYDIGCRQHWRSKGSRTLMRGVKNNYLLTTACAKLPLHAITYLHVADILEQRVHPYRDVIGKVTRQRLQRFGNDAADNLEGRLWDMKPEASKRILVYISRMFRHYRTRLKFKGDNPADRSEGSPLNELLGQQQYKGLNHQDIRVDELPPLMVFLTQPQREPNLITSDQLARALGITTIAVRNARKRRGLVGHKEPGRMWANASYVYERAEAERVFGRPIPPVTLRADEDLYASIEQMIILTLTRSDMVCKLQWDEIKPRWEGSVQGVIIWDKHKTNRFGYTYGTIITPHIQFILDAAKARLVRLGLVGNPYVFPHGPVPHGVSHWLNQPTNPNTMEKTLRRCLAQIDCIATKDATNHGMRTTFTTWACELNDYDIDIAMITIGHKLPGRSDADLSYLRNVKKLRKRYDMMNAWGDYCYSQCTLPQPLPLPANVTRLR
jgi:hypothetical protein